MTPEEIAEHNLRSKPENHITTPASRKWVSRKEYDQVVKENELLRVANNNANALIEAAANEMTALRDEVTKEFDRLLQHDANPKTTQDGSKGDGGSETPGPAGD